MRLVIIGASGFVGHLLVRALDQAGHPLLIVGRNLKKLKALYPKYDICTYENLQDALNKGDRVVNLAVINNDSQASYKDFEAVNVTLAANVCRLCKKKEVFEFVNVSSTHALDHKKFDNYSRSKSAGVKAIDEVTGINKAHLYLPTVYGQTFKGKLSFLNHTPNMLRVHLLNFARSLKPTVEIGTVAFWLSAPDLKTQHTTILSDSQITNPIFNLIKRSIDLIGSVTLLIIVLFFLPIIASLIKLDTPGPVIFKQQRIGQNGKPFECLKFRTMKAETPNVGTHEVTKSSVTRVGKFLRVTKLDEIPQLWNVIRNDMSLIGPRPCLLTQTRLIEKRTNYGVIQLKPGITGLSQVNKIDMSCADKLARSDLRYLALQSLMLDLQITFQTIAGRGNGDRIKNPTML